MCWGRGWGWRVTWGGGGTKQMICLLGVQNKQDFFFGGGGDYKTKIEHFDCI